MVKIYLRYNLKTTFGVVTSFPSNVVFDGSGKCAITGALEHVLIWDIKKGAKVASYSDSEVKKQPVVSQILLSPDKTHLATGCVWPGILGEFWASNGVPEEQVCGGGDRRLRELTFCF